MVKDEFFFYRGFPLVRSGNEIYYGSMGDPFVTKLTIKSSEKFKDVELPTKIMVQLIPTDGADFSKMKKGEMYNLYEALDTAYTWLCKELF